MEASASLAIEPLTEANVEELIEMLSHVDATHFAHATRDSAERFLKETEDVHVLGRTGDEVVAFGMLRGWREGFAIPSLGIAVRADREGSGFGRAMMEALHGLARSRGAPSVRLRVHAENHHARRLYESVGYREAGIERGEIVMVRDISTV